MALGLTGGLLHHCSCFLESLPHASLQVSKMIQSAFLTWYQAVPNLLELVLAAAVFLVEPAAGTELKREEMSVCVELFRRLFRIEMVSFLNRGSEIAVVPLCLLRQDFGTGFIVICCFLHNRLKKRSRMDRISLKVGFFWCFFFLLLLGWVGFGWWWFGFFLLFLFWAASALTVTLSLTEILGDGHNWKCPR